MGRGRLELHGADVGAVSVEILLDPGVGVTALSEDVFHRVQQPWKARGVSRPCTVALKAQVADGRLLNLTE